MSRFGLPHESAAYRALRDELARAEIALREQREKVAVLRRRLPQDTVLADDPLLLEGPRDLAAGDEPVGEVRLSQLCAESEKPVVLLHFMYGKAQTQPCPMCTLWADGCDGIVPHLEQRASFAVFIAGELAPFRRYARERGWRHLRILSAGASTLKRDLGFEDAAGAQEPCVSVFTRASDGAVRHFYSGGAIMDDGGFRGMDLLCPLWSFLDVTPVGRGDFMPRRSYE